MLEYLKELLQDIQHIDIKEQKEKIFCIGNCNRNIRKN